MIGAVIVTFFPKRDELCDLLDRLYGQVDRVCIVDNTPDDSPGAASVLPQGWEKEFDGILLGLGKNRGVATGLNTGIRYLLESGVDYVLLCDQDSLPSRTMVASLQFAYESLVKAAYPVGGVGPTFTDLHTNITFSFKANVPGSFFYKAVLPTSENPYVDTIALITSGTLVSREAFAVAGLMRDDLFIDCVDTEWCLRARSKGLSLYGVGDALMEHRMGDQSLPVWYFGWRRETLYPPTRLYYRVRNQVALCLSDLGGLRWKLRSSWYIAGVVYSHVFFSTYKLASWRMVLLGLYHGVRGKMGALENS
ncbi:MAG: rhamnosyltransferase [Congregibacter sp.]